MIGKAICPDCGTEVSIYQPDTVYTPCGTCTCGTMLIMLDYRAGDKTVYAIYLSGKNWYGYGEYGADCR